MLRLPNGSTIEFCYCENEKDLNKYQGRELSFMAIDEVGQWQENHFRILLASNRSANPNVKARCALSANPGGLGHSWLKRLFIKRDFQSRENPSDYYFIQSKIADNQALSIADPNYKARLESISSESLRRAWIDGDWDISAGMFFSELNRDIHLIEPFEIPSHWPRFGGYDWGFAHPAWILWAASDEDGNVYIYREWAEARKRVDEMAQIMLKHSESQKMYFHAGTDCWAKRHSMITKDQPDPPTIAQEFSKFGISLKPAITDRIPGAQQLRSYLACRGEGSQPKLKIFKTCPLTYDAIARMVHDPDKPEDVLKVDASEGDPSTGDDGYDCPRYLLMSRPPIATAKKQIHKPGTQEYDAELARLLEEGTLERVKRENAQKNAENQRNWNLDKQGLADWQKW
jgi:phage terminase large subunit